MLNTKRFTALALVLALFFAAPAAAGAAKTGTFTYGSFIGSNFHAPFYYDDAYFREPSVTYSNSLATMSMCLALSAFASKGTDDYARKSENLQDLLMQCGFEADTFAVNQGFLEKPGMDSIGVGAAARQITDENGQPCWLIACAVRGHGYQSEWAGNFTIGETGEHQGFESAARQVIAFLQTYAKEHPQINGRVKLWMAGYSRAAAVVNLTAGMIDDGEVISSDFTLGTDSVYAYCFECPQGTLLDLDVQNDRYANIFCIVNPADLVTKVAPTLPVDTFGFDRYGINRYLPSVMYDGRQVYKEKREKMLRYYSQLEGTDAYYPQEFQMKKISAADIWNGNIVIDDTNPDWTQEAFLASLIGDLAGQIGSRQEYVQTYQESIRQICRVLLGNSGASAAMGTFAESLRSHAALVAGYTVSSPLMGTEPLADFLEKELSTALESEGITDYDRDELRDALDKLADLVIYFGAAHPNYVATLACNAKGIASGHYPEMCLAWLMSFDPNYGEGNQAGFSHGLYRMALVNGPCEVSVLDEAGRAVGRIADGQTWEMTPEEGAAGEEEAPEPDTSLERVTCLVDEDGEMTAFLPIDRAYTLQITAKEEDSGECAVAEISERYGINRIVEFENLGLAAGQTAVLSVPAATQEELQRSYELSEGTSAVYALTGGDGSEIAPTSVHAGQDAEPPHYRTRVYSANIHLGRVDGGGVGPAGSYEQVNAYPSEGCRFTGWYEGETKVSEETTYRFKAERDRILTARFEE